MSSKSDNSGIYLYCIIPQNNCTELTNPGIDGQELFTIGKGDLLAVVSNSPYKVYDLSSENILIHEGIIREIMKTGDVIPFNFGNVLKSENDLNKFMEANYNHLQRIMKKVSGAIEVGLKAFIKNECFNDEVENEEIKDLKQKLEDSDSDKNYPLKVDLGKAVKKSLEQKQKEYEIKIFNPLKQHCFDANISECTMVKMILNAAFLIGKEKLEVFNEKVDEIISKYDDKLTFKYTGPWPPYNFIDMPD